MTDEEFFIGRLNENSFPECISILDEYDTARRFIKVGILDEPVYISLDGRNINYYEYKVNETFKLGNQEFYKGTKLSISVDVYNIISNKREEE